MIITSNEQYYAFMYRLLKSGEPMVSFDVETSPFDDEKNLKSWELELYGLGLYTPTMSAYIPKRFLDTRIQDLIDTKPMIGWNTKFDIQVLEENGFSFDTAKEVHDGMIGAWLCNENRTSYKLKDLALSVLKVKEVTRYSDMTERPAEGTKEFVAWEKAMGEYCIDDCEYTLRLHKVFEKKMITDSIWNLYFLIERPLIKVVSDMERRGIAVDVAYLESLKTRAAKELVDLKASVLAGIKAEMPSMKDDFNPGSTKQLSEYLFGHKKYKLPLDFVTPTGKPSTNEEALNYIVETYKCPVTTNLLKYRGLNKTYTAFLVGLLDKHKNGVIHCGFRQTGTKTGRFSSSNPNLQQIPTDSENYDIRKAFVARPGYTFVDADFSQMELRIGAYLSGSKLMIDTFKRNGDLHQTTADAIGCSRKVAKMVNFSIFYGIGPYGLSRRLGISEAEAEKIINGFFAKFPEVRRYLDDSANMLKTNYYVATELGRKRRFPEYIMAKKAGDYMASGRCERQAGNSRIQGLNADFTKIAMFTVAEGLKALGGQILLTVHDEIIAEVPTENAEKAAAVLKKGMEESGSLGEVPVVAEPKLMNYWSK